MKPLFALALMALPAFAAFPNGYSYCKVVTTQHTMVSGTSDLANYPLTVILTDADLRTTGNGGLVNSTSGYDIGFYPDCSGSGAALKWEIESYSPTTGAIAVHVLRPALSHTTNDTIGMFYGGGFSSFQSTASAVWDANYKGVWHLPNGTTLTANDSSANANHGSVVGAVTAAAGRIGGGANNAAIGTNGIRVADSASLRIATKLTISAWVYLSSGNTSAMIVQKRDATTVTIDYNYGLWIAGGSSTLIFEYYDTTWRDFYANTGMSLNAWHHVAVAVDETSGTPLRFYLDGAANGTPGYSGTMPSSGTGPLQFTNYDQYGSGQFPLNGTLDEVRISNTNRSADWILTEFRNQSAPGTYISAGPRLTGGAARVRRVVIGGV